MVKFRAHIFDMMVTGHFILDGRLVEIWALLCEKIMAKILEKWLTRGQIWVIIILKVEESD